MFEIIHIADVWSDMRKTISAVCTLAHENGDDTYAVSYCTRVSACSLTHSKQLCACISYSVRTKIIMRDDCSKETVSRSNILRRGLWQQDKPRLDNRNALWDFTRLTLYFIRIVQEKCHAPNWVQNADTHTNFVRACAVEMKVKNSEEPL